MAGTLPAGSLAEAHKIDCEKKKKKFLVFFMKNENTLSAKKKWFSQTSICVLLCFLCGGKKWRASNIHLIVKKKVWKQGNGFLSIPPRGKKKPVVLTLAIPSPQIPFSVLHWKQLMMGTEWNSVPSRDACCVCGVNELTMSVKLCENCPQWFHKSALKVHMFRCDSSAILAPVCLL